MIWSEEINCRVSSQSCFSSRILLTSLTYLGPRFRLYYWILRYDDPNQWKINELKLLKAATWRQYNVKRGRFQFSKCLSFSFYPRLKENQFCKTTHTHFLCFRLLLDWFFPAVISNRSATFFLIKTRSHRAKATAKIFFDVCYLFFGSVFIILLPRVNIFVQFLGKWSNSRLASPWGSASL